MDNDQRNSLKKTIEEKINKTRNDIASYEQLTKPVSPDNAIGRLTRMEAINSKSINEAALAKAKDTLLKLERALAKFDDPEFGECQECGEQIPQARLMILPETDLCVQCAEKRG